MKTETNPNTEPASSLNTLLVAAKPTENISVVSITSDGVKRSEITKDEFLESNGGQLSEFSNEEVIQKAKDFMWSRMDERNKSLLIAHSGPNFPTDGSTVKEIIVAYRYNRK